LASLSKPNYVRKRQYLLHLLTSEPQPPGHLVQKWNNLPDKVRTYNHETAAMREVHGYLAEKLPLKWHIRNGLKIVTDLGPEHGPPGSGTTTGPDRTVRA
jgi:hypothetical protein